MHYIYMHWGINLPSKKTSLLPRSIFANTLISQKVSKTSPHLPF